jgi:uncharacterized membrane protein
MATQQIHLAKSSEEKVADRKKITLPVLFNKVANHEPITWMTCYDYPTAYLMEQAGMGTDSPSLDLTGACWPL